MTLFNVIERKPTSDKYRIIGKGVTVEFLVQFLNDPEWPVVRICEHYGLTPSEVFAAWAFYYDYQEEIDRHIAEETMSITPEDVVKRASVINRDHRSH